MALAALDDIWRHGKPAIVVSGLLKMRVQSEKTRFVEMPTPLRSYRSLSTAKRTSISSWLCCT